MTDEEIREGLEACAHAVSATQSFFSQAFCVLAEQSGIDLQSLVNGIRPLNSQNEEETSQIVYTALKNHLLRDLEVLLKEQKHGGP